MNLLNWDGKGSPDTMFAPRPGSPRLPDSGETPMRLPPADASTGQPTADCLAGGVLAARLPRRRPGSERLDLVEAAIADLRPGSAASRCWRRVEHLRALPVIEASAQYAEVFDWKRRRTLFLTYYTAGDTRNRGMALLAFSDMYRAAGVIPPARELPDHLAVLLEFAATVDEARRLRPTAQAPHADRHAARRAAAGLARSTPGSSQPCRRRCRRPRRQT